MHSWRLIKCSVSFSIAIIIILSLEEEVSHIFNEHITYIYKNVCKSNMQLHVFTSYVLWWKKLKLILLLTKNRLVNILLFKGSCRYPRYYNILYIYVLFFVSIYYISHGTIYRAVPSVYLNDSFATIEIVSSCLLSTQSYRLLSIGKR